MNLLQLVGKQMRQRALSTWLTTLTVLLGVALAVVILIVQREGTSLFGQTDYGYEVLIGNKGSPLSLVLNTVYHLDSSPGNIPYSVYDDLMTKRDLRRYVKIAVPFAVGDSYKGLPIVGTLPKFFGFDDDGKPLAADKVLDYRPGETYQFAQGRPFAAAKFEAVLGSEAAKLTGLKIGDTFRATHGFPGPKETPDIHKPVWKIVGILAPTLTANDKALFIPLVSFYTLTEHDEGLVAQEAIRQGKDPQQAIEAFKAKAELEKQQNPGKHEEEEEDESGFFSVAKDGTIHLTLPQEAWGLSAVAVKTRSAPLAAALMYQINNGPKAAAVSPATVMRQFFDTFLGNFTKVLLLVSILVTVVAAVGILVSIYNSVAARRRETAILRALGATRGKILAIICVEAGLIGLIGGLLGLVGGHLLAAGGSAYTRRLIGQPIDWLRVGGWEWVYVAAVVVVAVLAGLVPALKAYATPVATNLAAE